MKNLAKKIIIYSMVGMMQLGIGVTIGATAIEASGDWQHRNDQHWEENQRHEREMHRRDWENDRQWNDRQWQENYDHERNGRDIDRD